jgi:hypothetical protein
MFHTHHLDCDGKENYKGKLIRPSQESRMSRPTRRLRPALVCLLAAAWIGCAKPGLSQRSPGNTTYYVDSAGGNDGNAGTTRETAWRTLAPVNRTVFSAGDRILLKAGSRFAGRLSPQGSGNPQAPIVVDMYGVGARPRIDAGGDYHAALLLQNQDYWEISNLELTNQGFIRRAYRYGVRLRSWDFGTMHHIHLRRLFVHDVNGSLRKSAGEGQGILWENGGKKKPSRFDDLLIEDCHLLRTDRNGICGYSENSDRTNWFPSLHVAIRHNLLEDIGGDGIKPWGCDGCVVEYNRLDKARQRCSDYAAGIWPWSCDNTLIQFNEVTGVKGTRDGEAFDSDGNCRHTVFQYNYSHDNEGGFLMICNDGRWKTPASAGNVETIVRYNISQNDGARIFHITGVNTDARIYNNTIFIGKSLDIPIFLFTDYGGWADGVYVANNIFYVEGKARYSHGTSHNSDGTYEDAPGFGQATRVVFQNNAYYGPQAHRPRDPGAITIDPRLVKAGSGGMGFKTLAGYKLQDDSPCFHAGVPIADNGGRDFWGNHVPEAGQPAIGVYEKGSKDQAGLQAQIRGHRGATSAQER